jgi:hypothetical protein
MNHTSLALGVVLADAVAVALGGVVTHLAYRAYRRTGRASLRSFALGVGLLTLASLGGGLAALLDVEQLASVLGTGLLAALGFAYLVYSLYARRGGRPARDPA